MANAPSPDASPAANQNSPELNLLLAWPQERSGRHWVPVILASLAIHALVLLLSVQLPEFVTHGSTAPRVIVKRTPLYLPRDLLTQRAPNREKAPPSVSLADLLATQAARQQQTAPRPSTRRFEAPKLSPSPSPKAPAQILAQSPNIAVTQSASALPFGSSTGLNIKAPPPPAPPQNPFQSIGSEPQPTGKPALAPPKATVQAAINGLAHDADGRHLIVSDNNQAQPMPGSAGSNNQMGAKSAIELQSDPQGADMRPYLIRILAIVRANWRRVIPESARLGALRGQTVVQFIVNRDGSIPKIVLADPSGSDPLDRAALAGMSMSNPLPPLPADYKGFQARLAFTFTYNMSQ